jgi:hypothetical protein
MSLEIIFGIGIILIVAIWAGIYINSELRKTTMNTYLTLFLICFRRWGFCSHS